MTVKVFSTGRSAYVRNVTSTLAKTRRQHVERRSKTYPFPPKSDQMFSAYITVRQRGECVHANQLAAMTSALQHLFLLVRSALSLWSTKVWLVRNQDTFEVHSRAISPKARKRSLLWSMSPSKTSRSSLTGSTPGRSACQLRWSTKNIPHMSFGFIMDLEDDDPNSMPICGKATRQRRLPSSSKVLSQRLVKCSASNSRSKMTQRPGSMHRRTRALW